MSANPSNILYIPMEKVLMGIHCKNTYMSVNAFPILKGQTSW